MKTISVSDFTSNFAENKDVAREIRTRHILPELEKGKTITLDFYGIDSMTQSFAHALLSDLIRKKGSDVLERIYFKNCNELVRKIINIVVEYMQDA